MAAHDENRERLLRRDGLEDAGSRHPSAVVAGVAGDGAVVVGSARPDGDRRDAPGGGERLGRRWRGFRLNDRPPPFCLRVHRPQKFVGVRKPL